MYKLCSRASCCAKPLLTNCVGHVCACVFAAAAKPAVVLLNTSSIASPDYRAHTTAGATAAALTLRQQAQVLAALRVAALQELRQEAAAAAALQEEARRQAAQGAAQADKQVWLTSLPSLPDALLCLLGGDCNLQAANSAGSALSQWVARQTCGCTCACPGEATEASGGGGSSCGGPAQG